MAAAWTTKPIASDGLRDGRDARVLRTGEVEDEGRRRRPRRRGRDAEQDQAQERFSNRNFASASASWRRASRSRGIAAPARRGDGRLGPRRRRAGLRLRCGRGLQHRDLGEEARLDLVGGVLVDDRRVDVVRPQLAELRVALHLAEELMRVGLATLDHDELHRRLEGVAPPLAIAGQQRHDVADEVNLALLGPGIEHVLRDEEEPAHRTLLPTPRLLETRRYRRPARGCGDKEATTHPCGLKGSRSAAI